MSEDVFLRPWGKLLRKPWYAFRDLVAAFYAKRTYVVIPPFGHRLYQPWFDPEEAAGFLQALKRTRLRGHTGLSPDRAYIVYACDS